MPVDPNYVSEDSCLTCGKKFRGDGPLRGRGDEAAATVYRRAKNDPEPGTRMGRVHVGCMKKARKAEACSPR